MTATPPPPPRQPLSGRTWLTLLAAVVAVAALLGGGYLLNRSLDDRATAGSAEPDSGGDLGGDFAADGGFDFGDAGAIAVTPTAALPTCAGYPPAVDSAGRQHSYEAPNAIDGDLTTAWRCAGTQGQRLSMSFVCGVHLTSVGVDPGYDKVDADGSDRFAQNRKVTRVVWTFDDGSSVEQQLRPERGIQTMPVETTTRTATMTVAETVDGQPVTSRDGKAGAPFNDVTSVSEVRFAALSADGTDPCAQ
ncbi:NADase-type glycan-binding domain-containing protein [Rhodococcus kronopolitis]|uniref:Uncharacterized protein n=1 Tax=Rhodococcus kronopolitis TaxID=1460226 RepID=A0ABV9FPS8_9NOCA